MVVIEVIRTTCSADTTSQGEALRASLERAMREHKDITLSFSGISAVTSSFINASLLPILDTMAFDEFKARIKIVNSTRLINDIIKRCLLRGGSLAA